MQNQSVRQLTIMGYIKKKYGKFLLPKLCERGIFINIDDASHQRHPSSYKLKISDSKIYRRVTLGPGGIFANVSPTGTGWKHYTANFQIEKNTNKNAIEQIAGLVETARRGIIVWILVNHSGFGDSRLVFTWPHELGCGPDPGPWRRAQSGAHGGKGHSGAEPWE